jgi:pyruvate/2-oxoglutarate dehydrogenase complex dihydrolipoamide dehydrogenase (E3) component
MADKAFDIVAIGGGTAGLVTAAGSAGLGARTALVERDRLGGDCLWTGCVPSKALIGTARLAEAFRRADAFGLEPQQPIIDGSAVLESVRAVRARIQPHDDPERFRGMGVDVIEGEARFVSPHELEVDGQLVRGRKFVIATGSRAAVPPIEGLENAGYYTHETAFDRAELPESVLIVGGGPIGIEFAQAYRRLGIDVTVVELLEQILPREDPELVERLRAILEEDGVRILTGRKVVRAERVSGGSVGGDGPGGGGAGDRGGADGIALTAEGADGTERLKAAEVLVATGRRPNVESLGLELAGVEVDRGGVVVDDRLRTSQKHIFAAGDVTGGYLFTHVADHEARTVVRNALFPFPTRISYHAIPWCTFTEPELAHVGLTESEARERHGDSVRAFTYELSGLDRAITDRADRGAVKLVVDKKGRIMGGHILASEAGTMISEVALAMKHGVKIGHLSSLVHPYPTMSEGVRRTADLYMRSKLTDRTRGWLNRYFQMARRFRL